MGSGEEMKHKIIVAGIGPGNPDYMVPAARQAILGARVLVGGRRALAQYARASQLSMAVTRDIPAVLAFLREQLAVSDVVVMVSGDPGYYSMLDALRREFPAEAIAVIPGISSLQLAFSRLALPWHDARLLSFHGRCPGMEQLSFRKGGLLGMLTDGSYHSQRIAQMLMEQGWPGDALTFVCSRLSYEDEQILSTTLEGAAAQEGVCHCVLVVWDRQEGLDALPGNP